MPVINGVYLKDFTALPGAVADADIIPIAITGNQIAYRTTVAGIVTDARITAKLLTGLSVTGGAVVAADTILQAFGKVQNQINGKQGAITLTTTGTSGAATLVGDTLNIPNYADGGVLSLSAIGGTANANAATITGTVLNLQPASSSFGGVVTSGAQNFAGTKTFDGNIILDSSPSGTAGTDDIVVRGADHILKVISASYYNPTITLTTTGTSGAATLVSNTLNIPNYGSALTGYVPYTGATTDVDLGAFKLNAQSLHVKGTAGNGHLGLKHQSSSATAAASESSLFADSNGDMSFQNANLYLNKFVTSANSANRTYTFPDATGTVALVGGSGVGTVTSVAALTLGTTGTDLSSTVANGTTTPVITLQVPTASATNRGALSSADWSTFNGKAAALSGTINTIAYWNSATTIASLAVATYPSLTELSYVKGVTSAIQTQLNAKQATITLTTTGTSGAATFVANTLNIPNYADGGVLSLSAIGGTANANGATITGTVLNLQPADASFGGVVTTGTQTFAGSKTFNNDIYVIGGAQVYGLSAIGEYDGGAQIPPAYGGNYALTLGSGLTSNGLSLYTTGKGYFVGQLRLDSTITNGTYTYTLPSATGTLALTSAIPANPVGGTGTANYVPKFTAASTIGNSQIFDNGTSVGIGTATPNITAYAGTVLTVGAGSSGETAIEVYGGKTGADGAAGDLAFLNSYATGADKRIALIRASRSGDNNSGSLTMYSRNAGTLTAALTIASTGAATFTGALSGTSATFSSSVAIGANLNVANTLAYGRAIISTSETKTNSTVTNNSAALFLSTNETTTPFGVKFFVVGNATAASRYVSLQTGEHNVANDGNLVFQKDGGYVGIGSASPGTFKLLVNQSAGVADYTARFIGSTTTGASYGVSILAGTNSSDLSFVVRDVTNTNTYLSIRGDGAATFSSSIAVLATGITVTIDDAGKAGYTITNSAAVRTYKMIAGIDGTSNTGFSIRNVTAGRNELLFTDAGAATFSSTITTTATGKFGAVNIRVASPTYDLQLSDDSAAKPSTNTWTIASDSRVKENITPYTKGLSAIMAINPVNYDYNGKAGFSVIKGNIGVIAQDVLEILPESVSTYKTKLEESDEEDTELYNFNSHALTYILINAIKELKAEIDLLKGIAPIEPIDNNLE